MHSLKNTAVSETFLKASFTVEASLISVAVVLSVLVCIYYSLVLHDKVLLDEAIYQGGVRAGAWISECSSLEDGAFDWNQLQTKGLLWAFAESAGDSSEISGYVKTLYEGGLIVCDEPELSIVSKPGSIYIGYTAKIRLPLPGVFELWFKESRISGQISVKTSQQEEFVRLVRGIIGDKNQENKE